MQSRYRRLGFAALRHPAGRPVHVRTGGAASAPGGCRWPQIGRGHVDALGGQDVRVDPVDDLGGRGDVVLGDQDRQRRPVRGHAGQHGRRVPQIDLDDHRVVRAPVQPDLEQVRDRNVEYALAVGPRP